MEKDKTQLMVEIDGLQIRHREISDSVTSETGNLRALEEGKTAVTGEVARLKEEFNVLNSQIAQEKLDWLQQKTREENELNEKKGAVSAILAKEEVLNAKEKELVDEKNRNQEILNESNRSLDLAQKERVASQALVNQANDISIEAEEKDRKADEKIASFKQKLHDFHGKIIEEFK